MPERISRLQLNKAVNLLNRVMEAPEEPYRRGFDGKLIPNEGCFTLDIANGGYAVERMCKGGGVSRVIDRGTARETFYCIHAMVKGAELMKELRG